VSSEGTSFEGIPASSFLRSAMIAGDEQSSGFSDQEY
jgi:hypothetical protein